MTASLAWIGFPLVVSSLTAWAVPQETPEDRIVKAFRGQSDFLWGSATASYQVEGSWDRDGRQESIWDVFSHTPGNTHENQTGDVADDFYNLYPADVSRVASYGFNAFRMSISWSRILPLGPDGVRRPNIEGVNFYKRVIHLLLDNKVTPFVTIFHWDLPADLDWLSESVVPAFADYAEFLFETFPEVKHWLTFNEPSSFCANGYGSGTHAPGVKSKYKQYRCGHHVLKAHAQAVAIYRAKYQQVAHGKIGITLNYDFGFPWNGSSDQDAAQLHHDFNVGWWADPIYLTGDYPASMKDRLGSNLPKFTEAEIAMLKGSSDFYGMNTYSAMYVKADVSSEKGFTELRVGVDGKEIGKRAASPWLYVVPTGIRAYLEYVHFRYQPQSIYVTENGCDVPGENEMPLEQALNDTFRVDFYRAYLDNVAAAVLNSGVPVKGYFAWSLLDNYEWADGYQLRFGLTYVNYTTQERYPKLSAKWFKLLLNQMVRQSQLEIAI